MNEPLSKLIKARDKLLDKYPLFGALMTMKYVERTDLPTAAVDGIHFFYNPEFILKHDDLQLQFLCFHEHDHVAMLHFARKGNRNHRKWNMATDYVINLKGVDLLGEKSFIPGGLLDEKYRGMGSEEVYNILPEPDPDDNAWDFGGVESPVDGKGVPLTTEEVEAIERQVKQAVNTAVDVQKAVGVGNLKGLVRDFDEVVNPSLPYSDRLLQLMKAQAHTDWSYRKVDKYRMDGDIMFPSLCNETVLPPIIAVDTSGSISKKEVSDFIGHTFGVLEEYNFPEIEVIYCDDDIRNVEVIGPEDDPRPQGGGGTDFAPVMRYLTNKDTPPTGLIYYTDGECWNFGEDPECPVLWVLSQKIDFNPPFGEVAYTIY